MSTNAVQTNIDVAQLTRNIREQIRRTSRFLPDRVSQEAAQSPLAGPLLENLRSTQRELDGLASQVEAGEPSPPVLNWRQRIGFLLKRRLYRLLWWHSHQIKALTALVARCER